MNKQRYLIIIFSLILIFVIVGIVTVIFISKPPEASLSPIPSPTLAISPLPTGPAKPGAPPVSYKSDATDRLIEKVRNHPELSASDSSAKQKILALLPSGKSSGYVYESVTVKIQYLSSPDTFLAEILTKDILKAKTDAVDWLKSQGLSQKGICDLPVSFYINYHIANDLRDSNVIFSPLPEGC